jgi:arylsulfatase A-like enzyme
MAHRLDHVLKLACWFGLLTGIGDVALLGIKKFYLGRVIRFGLDVVWMAPLADTILFVICGSILLGMGRLWPRRISPRLVVFVFVFLTLMSWLLVYYPLHVYAKLLLAAGAATQASRAADRWRAGFDTFVRRSLPVMTALLVLATAGVLWWPGAAEKRAISQLARGVAGAPNVVLITMDTVRAADVSLYGYGRPTMPNLERWARTGVVFDRATSTAPWTLTSHASMFTGRWPHELSATLQKPLDNTHPTLAEALRDRGYVTAGFVANTFYCGYEFGLGRGFLHYDDYSRSFREFLIASPIVRDIANSSWVRRLLRYYDNIPRKNAETLTSDFIRWLPSAGDRPFFAFLNYFDAHEVYLPPAPFDGKFGEPRVRSNHLLTQDLRRGLRSDWNTRPAEEIRAELDLYDGAIAYVDAQLDRLFTELQSRGILNNTVVIVTSDHGEQFGEHGLFLHGNSLYDQLLHVPLVILYPPNVPAGRRMADRVSLRDLPATVLDLVGSSGRSPFPGSSLARFWAGGDTGAGAGADLILSEVDQADWEKDWYPIAKGDMQSLASGAYHYIRNGDGREELYATDEDPREERDLSREETSRPILERFRAQMDLVKARGR